MTGAATLESTFMCDKTLTSCSVETASLSSGASAISASSRGSAAGSAATEPRPTRALCAATRACGSGSLARTSALSRAANPAQAPGLFASSSLADSDAWRRALLVIYVQCLCVVHEPSHTDKFLTCSLLVLLW